ncbi:MAG TPA: KamA family radical SAM protein [Rectinemataceae bacterium]|nr:KamA family radical SAM protein [Rectinemataceae bacterium]
MNSDSREAMRKRITILADAENKALLSRLKSESALPFAATAYWLGLASEDYRDCRRNDKGVPLDPILAQALPSRAELERIPLESRDPLCEEAHSPLSRLVHQYPSRILLRTTGECPVYCRHCFRRSLLPQERGFIDEATQEEVRTYLESHQEVREVLVSGGDPLSASTPKLEALFSRLRAGKKGILIRLCTRAPVTLPDRVDEELVEMLSRFKPLRVVIQVNHPAEISPLFAEKMEMLIKAGLPVRSQSVLLRGVNDSVDTLEALFSGLVRVGVDPYYLFQGDMASGTAHFRVPLSRGLAIYGELRKRLSGLELPRYAVDAPDGAGKMYLPESVAGMEDGFWILKAPDGSLHRYPEEKE